MNSFNLHPCCAFLSVIAPQASRSLRQRRGSRSRNGGFTLIEVALALGVIAVAIVPMIGLLSMGLTTTRQAADTTIESQILQRMINQVQQTDFSRLETLNMEAPVCFDYQGIASAKAAVHYKASFDIATNTSLPGNSTYKLATVTVCILTTRGGSSEQDLKSNPATRRYTILTADNGR